MLKRYKVLVDADGDTTGVYCLDEIFNPENDVGKIIGIELADENGNSIMIEGELLQILDHI